jgi:hypothetical protein
VLTVEELANWLWPPGAVGVMEPTEQLSLTPCEHITTDLFLNKEEVKFSGAIGKGTTVNREL